MSYRAFDEKELRVTEYVEVRGGSVPVFNTPITPRENSILAHAHKQPCWMLTDMESRMFCPSIIPDHRARGCVTEAEKLSEEEFGGPDMFGVEWRYVPVAGGSMVVPGNPVLTDANDWREVIRFPDIDSWDWEGSAEKNREYLQQSRQCTILGLLNGCWFERLLSFMDFEGAAMALIDEDQREALRELLHETTSLYMRILDKCVQYYRFDGVCIHDDWGSQMAPFFSEEVARSLFLPEMKRFVDHAHQFGKFVDLHSCGHVEERCNIFVEAGFDAWKPMPMNNTVELYQKYGDKIIISVVPDKLFDPQTASEEEQRQAARDFVAKYTQGDKLCCLAVNYCPPGFVTQAYREELYRASRIRYAQGD